jgi:cysteine synthase B
MEILTKYRPDRELVARVRWLERQVGHTPVHAFTGLFSRPGVQIFGKQEWMQLSGSVKARAAYRIFRDAVERGYLTRDKILLDATSGNTGIAYAHIGKLLGIGVALCLPENASDQRKKILDSLGAELILTSRFEGTDGAQAVAKELNQQYPGRYYYADQYQNENNWKAHFFTTAPEIMESIPGVTHFVAGLGTTGTFTGTGRKLKKLNPSIELVSLQPDSALHGLEGWKHMETAVVPGIYDSHLADRNLEISTEEAYQLIKKVKLTEGLLLSPSSAANLAGAIQVAEGLERGIVVTILPDNGDKYLEVNQKLFGNDPD